MDIQNLTSETILDPSVFDDLFLESDPLSHEILYQDLLERSKALGVKGKFEGRYKALKKKHELEEKSTQRELAKVAAEERMQTRQTAITCFNSEKYPELLSGSWIADEDGVRTYGMFGEVIACYHPIMPVKRLVNLETDKEKMVIAFKKNGRWREKTYDKSTILLANKIAAAFTDVGILLSSENAKYLVKYFVEIEAMNMDIIPTQMSTSKMGWVNEYEHFMPYAGDEIIFDSESSFKSLYDAISSKGSKQKYIDMLKNIRAGSRKEPMMCIAASLASVLVKPCGVLPFIFHLYGEAGKGKTVTLMLAASIWGSPDENGFMADPKSTKTAFEMRLNFLNNLPFICDDMAQLKKFVTSQKNGDFSDFIYLVCSGKGNERSNVNLGLNAITTWKNATITSGEKPITGEVSNGGELLRVIDYQTQPGYTYKDGKGTADFLRKNYGHLGMEFVSIVQEIGFSEIKSTYEYFFNKLSEMDSEKEKEGKQMIPVALMLTADRIFTDYIMQDGIYLDIKECFNLIKSNKQMSDNERAYEFIINEVMMHNKKFLTSSVEPEQRWGYFDKEYVLINPNAFSGFCERGNFNKKMFIEWAVGKGIAKANKGRIDYLVTGYDKKFICIKITESDIPAWVDQIQDEEEKQNKF